MSNGIRITRPTDFMGKPLATEEFVATSVETKVAEVIALPEGVPSIIDPATGKINEALSLKVAIKPFQFTLDSMVKTEVDGANPTYSLVIPGFVFNLINNDTGMVMGDIEYTEDGSSKVVFVDLDATVLGSSITFTAFTFVNNDGSKINLLETQII